MNNSQLSHKHNPATAVLMDTMPKAGVFSTTAELFGLLSDPTRVKLLWLLCHTEDCVLNIATAMDMSSPAISHHLKILKQYDILTSRKEGKEVYYKLADNEKALEVHKIIDTVANMNCITEERK